MTTDNTQELDEILVDNFEEIRVIGCTVESMDRRIAEAKQALLDWHNKQTLELLDRLELNMRGKTVIDTADGWKEFIKKHVNGAIEAERNKLKEEEL